ncbi:MAG: NAD-dependent epimerase/dehydratase family protein [Alphaproteobacteria bacterium]|nr:NAD-dependent epimerase/dehydratase family protein [Alphaproteobacteria bacterium]
MSGAILVTGASGFIGTALCRHLIRQGRRVIGVVRRSSAKLPAGVERRVVPDIGLATDWAGQLGDVDTVVHLAARVHIMRERAVSPLYAFRYVNTYGTRKLAKASVAQGVRRMVYISSVKALGDGRPDGAPYRDDDLPAPTDAYGQSKLEGERILEEVGGDGRIETVVLRPPLVYGPGVRGNFRALMKLCDTPLPLPLGELDNRRSLLAQDNLIDAITRAIDDPRAAGRIYLLRDGEDLSTSELIRRLRVALGRPERLVAAPVGILPALGNVRRIAGAVQRLTGTLTVDDRAIRRELGWTPPVDVDTALSAVATAWRNGWGR